MSVFWFKSNIDNIGGWQMKLLSKKYFNNETKMEFIVIKLFSTIIPCCYGITSSVFKSMQGS